MKKEFLLNIILLVGTNLLVKPFFVFGIELTVQNRVPEGDYGLFFTLWNFTYLFQILNDFGIQNFNNRNLSRHPHLLPKFFPNLLWLKVLLGVFYFGCTALAAKAAGYDSRAMGILSILLLNQILMQFILFFRSNISGLGFFRTDSLLSSLDKFLMLLTCGAALWLRPSGLDFSIELFAWAQTLALAATAATAFFILKKYRSDFPIFPSWRLRAGGKLPPQAVFLLKKSFPFALVILLMTAYTRLDAVLLERLLPDGKLHADVYAGAYRLLDAANNLGYLFATLLLPMFARLLSDREKLRELVSLSFKLIWSAAVSCAFLVCFWRRELLELMMPERASQYRWDTLGLLIWTFVPVATTYIFSTLLTANENLRQMNRFFVGGLLLDVVLNLLLIPRWQAIGSAWATVGTQAFIAGGMVWLCVREFGFRASGRGVFQVFGFAVFVCCVCFLIQNFVPIEWFWQVALAATVSIFGVFLFGILRLAGLQNLIGQFRLKNG